MASPMKQVKALLFDCFGTCTDWRTSVTRALRTAAAQALDANPALPATTRAAANELDWADFAAEWRGTYYHYIISVARDPSIPVKSIDQHHLDSLRKLLAEHGVADLFPESAVEQLSRTWHFLDAWRDVAAGIRALNALGVQTCTLSNGNVELLQDMAAHNGFAWTHIFSSAMFGTYKPNPKVYLGGAEKLGLQPGECAMVAAHLNDLQAAKECGLRTIYTARPQEEAWDAEKIEETRKAGWVDIWVDVGEGADGELPEAAKKLAALKR